FLLLLICLKVASAVGCTVIRITMAHPRTPLALVVFTVALTAACHRGDPSAAPPAPPPMSVGTIVLQNKPIEQASDFIATVRSLKSSTVQPDVEGVVSHIFVKSGDHVSAGAPVVQIKPDKQQATVQSTEANRAGVEADVEYWRGQVTRLDALVAA